MPHERGVSCIKCHPRDQHLRGGTACRAAWWTFCARFFMRDGLQEFCNHGAGLTSLVLPPQLVCGGSRSHYGSAKFGHHSHRHRWNDICQQTSACTSKRYSRLMLIRTHDNPCFLFYRVNERLNFKWNQTHNGYIEGRRAFLWMRTQYVKAENVQLCQWHYSRTLL